ncbi:hypothetical protein JSE7799_03809 [Jannaschia seosinensis]|uniref:CENP-V/GFA domain-containing protein n=1 Tax=Jannaschia seosinensis TaxID=313367 RepID=A0A0M7BI82_9RHOB|nr:DUF6151 family protein [Jannaschia seosinensis]CUH41066.1 hypothetical protein JSE7799_03809 [Jannaschia seosinensis]
MEEDGTLGFSCACGTLRSRITDVSPAAYTHIVCHCDDCRSAYTHLGQADPQRVGILQTTQDRIHISQGGEKLRVLRHTSRGALRWYATCCDTPLFFTPLKARLAHVGVNTDRLDDSVSIGKVTAEGFLPSRDGKHRHKGAARMVARIASRILAKNLSGEWRDTPFFDKAGAPVVEPRILTREERAAALMALGR